MRLLCRDLPDTVTPTVDPTHHLVILHVVPRILASTRLLPQAAPRPQGVRRMSTQAIVTHQRILNSAVTSHLIASKIRVADRLSIVKACRPGENLNIHQSTRRPRSIASPAPMICIDPTTYALARHQTTTRAVLSAFLITVLRAVVAIASDTPIWRMNTILVVKISPTELAMTEILEAKPLKLTTAMAVVAYAMVRTVSATAWMDKDQNL